MSRSLGMMEQPEGKPFIVFLSSNENINEQTVVEQTTLKDERVSLGSKFFTMLEAEGETITKTHPYYKWIGGRKLPRVIVFTNEGDRVGKLEGQPSPSKLYAIMKKAAAKSRIKNLDRKIKDYQKILTSLDKISTLKQALASKESRDDSRSAVKEIAKKRKAIEQDELELREAEEKILSI